jgi:aryl-alcohol dehydrogenase-like predicted oxidoreductase
MVHSQHGTENMPRNQKRSICGRTPDPYRETGAENAPKTVDSATFAAKSSTMASIKNMASTTTAPQMRTLGNSDLQLTPIGFGAWAIGGGNWQFGWGSQDDDDSVRTIERALDLGINWIDTAAVYGLGRSEEVVARALKNSGKRPYIFTKCSMRWDDKREIYRSLKAASLQEELENSLRRLQVETIDLYQIHWPNPDEEIEEGWETLAKLQKQGKVRYIGVSNFNVDQIKRAQKIAPVTSLQPPYSLVNPAVEKEILPYCQQQNIGVINYSPMASGLLTGKMTAERIQQMPEDDWRRRNPNFQEPKLSRNLKLAELLREIGSAHGVQPGVVAIAWTLRNAAVTAAIVGARRPDQVDGILPALHFRLSQEEVRRIDHFLAEHP